MQQAITDPSPIPDPETLRVRTGKVKAQGQILTNDLTDTLPGHVQDVDFLLNYLFEALRMVELRFSRSAVREVCFSPWSEAATNLAAKLHNTGVAGTLATFVEASKGLWEILGQIDDAPFPPDSTAAG